jgi:glycerol-1-phosphate dehydrogenase [NAD(P)+]
MNPWMAKLTQVLAAEGILNDPDEARYVPAQAYSFTLTEFAQQFMALIRSSGWAEKRISIFVDGVPKKCSEGRNKDIDDSVRDILRKICPGFDWIDLSVILGVAPADIHTSHVYLDKVREVLRCRECDVIVILGSGSLTDLVKHSLYLEGLPSPLISIPTALTVTAFTSSFSVIDFHGAKRTQISRNVTATFWVKPFLECAPLRMSRAGYGDLLARFVAYGDWFLGYHLGVMDRYSERSFRLMEPFATGIRTNATGFTQYPLSGETTACTAAALAMAGIAMSTAGETTPLSGYEHVISHGLDFLRLVSGRELVFHGEQVALGSLVSARTIDWLIGLTALQDGLWRLESTADVFSHLAGMITAAPIFGSEDPPLTEREMAALTEKLAVARQEFANEYEKKSVRWQKTDFQRKAFTAEWVDIKQDLARLTLRATDMEKLLRQSGLPCKPEETTPPTTDKELRWAIGFAPFVRSRMNIADLIYWIGKDPTFILTTTHSVR